jgi:hypothetical protein
MSFSSYNKADMKLLVSIFFFSAFESLFTRNTDGGCTYPFFFQGEMNETWKPQKNRESKSFLIISLQKSMTRPTGTRKCTNMRHVCNVAKTHVVNIVYRVQWPQNSRPVWMWHWKYKKYNPSSCGSPILVDFFFKVIILVNTKWIG